jgi:hypothetical protein
MFVELTSRLVFAPFTATPPHFSAPVRLMHATRPIKVFLLRIVVATVLTRFDTRLKVPFFLDQASNSFFLFVFLFHKHFDLTVLLVMGVSTFHKFISIRSDLAIELPDSFFESRCHCQIFHLQLSFQ